MPASRIYLDHNASAPLRPAARDAMIRALDITGNPSSSHTEGRAVRALVETARRQVAALVGADPRGVVFTSGATEAANLVLRPELEIPGRVRTVRLLAGATEHPCVLAGHRFRQADTIAVDGEGVLRLDLLDKALRSGGPALVAVQAANNETGVRQPVRDAADMAHAHGGTLVCDAVQAAGRVALDVGASGADAIVLSSHKLGGPKGAGALIFADPDAHIANALIRGGGQERGLRSGTEDVAAIAGFGVACAEVAKVGQAEAEAVGALRDTFEDELRQLAPAVILGRGASRLPNTSCFGIPDVQSATLLMALDLAGIAVAAGSACSSGKVGRSPILEIMGIDPHISGMVRVSFGWNSERADVAALLNALKAVLARFGRVERAA